MSPDGWFAGGQIGVNWQPRPDWLLGLEFDYQGGHSSGARTNQTFGNLFLYIDSTQQRLAGLGTLRARVGYVHGPVVYYITGGAASAKVTTIATDFMHPAFAVGPVDVWSASGTVQERRYGWTIGGGIETRLSDHWSFKLEYLLVDLGRQEFSFVNRLDAISANLVTVRTDISEQLLRFGVNYRFAGL